MRRSSPSDDCTARIPMADGGCRSPGEAKVRISLDLVTAARRHLAFLKSLFDSSFVHHSPTVLRAIRRYHELWMPLISNFSTKELSTAPMLLPPLDLRWVWHCHCLSPASYRHYCTSRFGRLVERPAIFDDENEEYASNRCRDIWAAEYPFEPFDLETDPGGEGEDEGGTDGSSSCAGGDLFAVVAKYLTLFSLFLDPFVAETVYLVSARQRYIGFLHLCRRSSPSSTSAGEGAPARINVCFEGDEDLPDGGGSKYGTSIRLEVALDPATLHYLHRHAPVTIVHRDMKPSSVVLDEQGVPKLVFSLPLFLLPLDGGRPPLPAATRRAARIQRRILASRASHSRRCTSPMLSFSTPRALQQLLRRDLRLGQKERGYFRDFMDINRFHPRC